MKKYTIKPIPSNESNACMWNTETYFIFIPIRAFAFRISQTAIFTANYCKGLFFKLVSIQYSMRFLEFRTLKEITALL